MPAAERAHVDDLVRERVEHRAGACDVRRCAAHERNERAVAHARDRPEHRRIDDARAVRLDRRREIPHGDGLQRAHLDEQRVRPRRIFQRDA